MLVAAFLLTVVIVFTPSSAPAQADYKRYYDEDNLPKVREIFAVGRYDIVLQICNYALQRGQPSWEWRVLRFESLANLGRYEEAVAEARELLAAAEAAGTGVFAYRGKMVDGPILKHAAQTLRRAGRA